MAERKFKMNTKTNKKANNNKQNKNVKGKQVKTLSCEQKETRNELIKLSERIKDQYHEINKLENSINLNTYEIGKTLEHICTTKLFKSLENADHKPHTFKSYCECELPFSSKYAYMLIKAFQLQNALEAEGLTKSKQGHHQLRKLSKYIDDLELLKKIWLQASSNDPMRVLNMADVVTAIEAIVPESEEEGSDDPVENAYNNVMKWGGLKKLSFEQLQQLVTRLNDFINNDVNTKNDGEDNN